MNNILQKLKTMLSNDNDIARKDEKTVTQTRKEAQENCAENLTELSSRLRVLSKRN